MQRLLFITSTRIGDAVLSTGLLAHLIGTHHGIRVTIACGAPAAPLFEGVPGLEQVIVMQKQPRGGHWWRLWKQIVTTRWDIVVDLRRSLTPWTLLARQRLVLGSEGEAVHKVVRLASVIGLQDEPPAPTLWTLPRHEAEAERLIPDGVPVLAVGPTANWRAKTWRAERFAGLIARLTGPAGILPGARVAFFGGPGERAAAAPAVESVAEERRIDLVGTVDPLTAYACVKRCVFYVGNDSGLMHIAAATGVPTLGLFGPTQEAYYAPWGKASAVVRTATPFAEIFPPGFDHRTTDTLMDTLTVEMAETAARDLWARANG